MADTTPAIVWTADASGNITYHNPRWLTYTGLTAEENRDWPRLVLHSDDYGRCISAWQQALTTGTDDAVEVRNRRDNGEYHWFLTQATPIRAERGDLVAWYDSATDIHDLKMAEQRLQEADRHKGELEEFSWCLLRGMLRSWENEQPSGRKRAVGRLVFPIHDAVRQGVQNRFAGRGRQANEFPAGLGGELRGTTLGVAECPMLQEERTQRVALETSGPLQDTPCLSYHFRRPVAEQMDERKGGLLLLQIGAQRLAGRVFLANEVEQVVGNLEGNSKCPAVASEPLDRFRGHAGVMSSQAAAASS